ncbi:MAG: phospholipase D family protein [Gammaproteobacteria bacterium]|nr:phospholipase D family protein [Gammaproteobacteria bacterium]MCP4090225.1 phospholipase D family protein [Gammaproteobacteria bacterium]MCP4832653.1 phospholipase D family protein [Gammaproteobacteria bacterium]MCP4930097.1 phospholipase D family protein [Gammaproteobacteria bacterium]
MKIAIYFKSFFLASLLGILTACSSVNWDYPKPTSTALTDYDGTYLDGITDPFEESHPGKSGFSLKTDGIDALAARLFIARHAQKTIDAQYYLISNDAIGNIFINTLLQAADRGVRVRLLLDDIQTKGYDAGLAALNSHPNFEIRIFNPFSGRSFRAGDVITSFSRINRRMHNKSFTVDNQVTIIGGRNIADEYFGARSDVNFNDVDVIAIGPVVRDVSTMFDIYWNHKASAPIPAFAKMPKDPATQLLELRTELNKEVKAIQQTEYAEAVLEDYDSYFKANIETFTWADYRLAYDSPDKVYKKVARKGNIQTITSELVTAVEAAQKQLIIISPYFVPRKNGIEYLLNLRSKGIEIIIITNSLAANNHGIVHAGYMSSRKPLLEAGVKIYEARTTSMAEGVDRGANGDSLATLHTKAFLVDCTDVFIGSFNWDPRSININTEMGVIITSAEIGNKICENGPENLRERTYEVVLNDKGKVQWIDNSGEAPVIYNKEPDTNWWQRFKVGFQRMLPIKGQL